MRGRIMSETFDPARRRFIGAAGAIGFSMFSGSAGGQQVPLAPPDKQPPNLEVPKPPERTVGWAIVGLGELALGEVMPAFRECRLSRPVALVSGHPDKAKQVASVYGIDPKNIYNYDNYDGLSDNSDVQAIYIILPNSMHAEFTIRGAKAGKHVLCEKPMSATVAEADQMIAAAREAQRKLMIAYRLRYEPFNMKAIELCRNQELGPIQTIAASNGQNVSAPNIRLSKKLAGGPLGDVGVYCLNAARYLTGEEPMEVTAMSHQPKDDPRFREVPASVVWTMRFPSGVLANCDCSFNIGESRRYRVHCKEGYIDLDPAFSYRGLELRTNRDMKTVQWQLTPVNHFAAEMDHFSECILQNKAPRTPGEEGLADMRVMAAIGESAAAGRAVKLGV
jgi:predicted dehydrogenase